MKKLELYDQVGAQQKLKAADKRSKLDTHATRVLERAVQNATAQVRQLKL